MREEECKKADREEGRERVPCVSKREKARGIKEWEERWRGENIT